MSRFSTGSFLKAVRVVNRLGKVKYFCLLWLGSSDLLISFRE